VSLPLNFSHILSYQVIEIDILFYLSLIDHFIYAGGGRECERGLSHGKHLS